MRTAQIMLASTDRLLSDVVLYASWVDGQELKTVSIDTYARSYDVDANDFTITVTDKSGRLTKEEVKNKVSVKNVSDSSENTSIDITAGSVLDDGAYTFIIKCNAHGRKAVVTVLNFQMTGCISQAMTRQ